MRRSAKVLGYILPIIANTCFAASLNFDSLNDGDLVTNQFSAQGVTFQNAIALAAGISLNEFEFPPRSNSNVISDSNGPLSIIFSTPQPSIFAYFTYAEMITLNAYDATNTLLGSLSSAVGCASNALLSGTAGCSPNELLTLSGLGDISRVVITGNLAGGSFVLDDLDFPVGVTTGIPEPSTVAMLAGGLGVLVLSMRRRSSRSLKSECGG